MKNAILVTGAAGRVGAVGGTVTELLLKKAEWCARWCEMKTNARGRCVTWVGVRDRQSARSRFDA